MITDAGAQLIPQVYLIGVFLIVVERLRLSPRKPIKTVGRAVWFGLRSMVVLLAALGGVWAAAVCVVAVASGTDVVGLNASLVAAAGVLLGLAAFAVVGDLVALSFEVGLDKSGYEGPLARRRRLAAEQARTDPDEPANEGS